ncbi:NADPH:quinone oxidoreductase family protein [Phenylobacterium sp. LjRoot164]|uniref:NADPH:quinone oxidoreductase family protein n=1 Tax=unclassified Phenylobacterium TaxID=2640670 RepID=UPI003ECECD60
MRRVQATSLSSIDDYRIIDADPLEPGPGEVLIDVAACGVGYVDALVALGRYQVKPPLPHTPGQEAAGRVAKVGPGVVGLAPGERVMANVRGGFAQQALAPAAAVRAIPERLAFAQAAGFHINYVTALHALADRANLQAGETVVVLGAAGGLGAAGLQVAKLLGARVIAAASTEAKRDFCRDLGADEVLDTAPDGWRERLKAAGGGRGPDVVFDPVCGPLFEPAFRSLSWRGRHLVLGFVGGPIPALPANLPLMKGAALVGVDVRQFMLLEPELARAHLDRLLDWAADGRLAPPRGQAFALDAFAQALEFALTGQGVGKTVLEVADL